MGAIVLFEDHVRAAMVKAMEAHANTMLKPGVMPYKRLGGADAAICSVGAESFTDPESQRTLYVSLVVAVAETPAAADSVATAIETALRERP